MEFPQQFGKYTLLRQLATGGMAEIFLARQQGMGGFEKEVVVKRLLPSRAADVDLVEMFLDEARIAANLTHPNIAQIFDLGREGEAHFIAMEYVKGVDLSRVCAHGIEMGNFIPLPSALRIIVEVCAALAYAHEKSDPSGAPMDIVHRDISPTNVLVTYDGGVKLVDFGIAKAASRSSQTKAGQIKGKFGYMAPEQVRGEATDARTDLFAVGINLYEITLGRRVFEGGNDIEAIEAIEQGRITAPCEVEPNYPKALEAIVLKALALDPVDRYQSARALQRDLEAFMADEGMRSTSGTLSSYMRHLFEDQMASEAQDAEQMERARKAGGPVADAATLKVDGPPAALASAPPATLASADAPPPVPSGRTENRAPAPDSSAWSLSALPTPGPEALGLRRPPKGHREHAAAPLEVLELSEADLVIRSPRSYTGLLVALLIAVGGYGLFHFMSQDNGGGMKARIAHLDSGVAAGPAAVPVRLVSVRLSSEPAGARVVLNGNVLAGKTPLAIELPEGRSASVTMLLDGYQPAHSTTRVKGHQLDVKAELKPVDGEPKLAKLRVESTPSGAQVSLNGVERGQTPLDIEDAPAGVPLVVRLTKGDYHSHTAVWRVAEGGRGAIGLSMTPLTSVHALATVAIESTPPGVSVSRRNAGRFESVGTTGRMPVLIRNTRPGDQLALRGTKAKHEAAAVQIDIKDLFYTVNLELPKRVVRTGTLEVKGPKGLTVYVGSEELGGLPIKPYTLTEGKHTMVVVDPTTRKRRELELSVGPDRPVVITVSLTEGELKLAVDPR